MKIPKELFIQQYIENSGEQAIARRVFPDEERTIPAWRDLLQKTLSQPVRD